MRNGPASDKGKAPERARWAQVPAPGQDRFEASCPPRAAGSAKNHLGKNAWQTGSSSCHTAPKAMTGHNSWIRAVWFLVLNLLSASTLFGGEADIKIPPLDQVHFGGLSGMAILYSGLLICAIGAGFGLVQYQQTRKLPVHPRMRDVSNI